MFKKLLASAVVFATCVSAQAQSSGGESEFFFQSKAGQSDLTPRIGYRMVTTKDKTPGATEDKANGLSMTGVSYEYGINEMFALEGALYYSSLETDATPKTKVSGLSDPTITLKGTSLLTSGRLRYGAALGLGFEKRKVESNGDVNMATGGYSLAPYIGMDADVGGGILGGRLMYTYKMERTTSFPGAADSKEKDGHEMGLSAFYEFFAADMLLGGSVNYRAIGATKDSDSGIENSASQNITGISLYSRIPMGTWALIPKVDYDFSNSEMDKWDDLSLSVAARFAF